MRKPLNEPGSKSPTGDSIWVYTKSTCSPISAYKYRQTGLYNVCCRVIALIIFLHAGCTWMLLDDYFKEISHQKNMVILKWNLTYLQMRHFVCILFPSWPLSNADDYESELNLLPGQLELFICAAYATVFVCGIYFGSSYLLCVHTDLIICC